MKKQICLILSLLLLLSLPLTAFAANTEYVIDNAGLLSDTEIYDLQASAEYLNQTYAMDFVILTVDSLEGWSAEAYADNYYDGNGYGDDGVLFLLAMAEREWYISTCGNGIYAFTDFGIQQLGESALRYLSAGDYYGAFDNFLTSLPHYLEAFEAGTPVDGYADYSGDYYHGTQDEVVYYSESGGINWFVSIAVGLAVAVVVILVMRSSMNSKRPRNSAEDYIKSGSYHLRTHQDLFLYSNVTKVRRQENNNSSRGGGSSVHRSSGGRSHGGGGGRF